MSSNKTFYDDGEQSIFPSYEIGPFLDTFTPEVRPMIIRWLTNVSNDIEREKSTLQKVCEHLMEKITTLAEEGGVTPEVLVQTTLRTLMHNVDLSFPRLIDLQYTLLMTKRAIAKEASKK